MHTHGKLNIAIFNDDLFYENGMLLWRDGEPGAWIVDPGLPPQPDLIAAAIRERNLTPQAILLTHAHADHIAGIAPLQEMFPGLPLWAPRGEAHLLTDARENLSEGIGLPVTAPAADRLLEIGEEIEVAGYRWRVLDVAGHSPGGIAYYAVSPHVAIVGDAVFAEGIGRTDFFNSDHDRLIMNLRDNILTLADETMLYPGHGPRATVGQVRDFNHTLRGALEDLAER